MRHLLVSQVSYKDAIFNKMIDRSDNSDIAYTGTDFIRFRHWLGARESNSLSSQ